MHVWENLDLGRVYRPHCVRSVFKASVNILPNRPPARLIRAKYIYAWSVIKSVRKRIIRGDVHSVYIVCTF